MFCEVVSYVLKLIKALHRQLLYTHHCLHIRPTTTLVISVVDAIDDFSLAK